MKRAAPSVPAMRAEARTVDPTRKTVFGLDENLGGTLAYALGWVTGIAMLLAERNNRFVRFHAIQSIVVFGSLCGLWFIGWSISIFGWLFFALVIPPISAVLWLLLLFKAYQGEQFKLPIAGDIAEQRS